MTTRLGVDVGGTFTDLVLHDDHGVRVAKVPSTPQDQAEGILAGAAAADADLAALDRFAHGTTVATNTVLERDGARTVLVTTAGFRDLLTIGRQSRPHLYDLAARRPAPVVPSAMTVEADERVGADGEVVHHLDDAEVARVVDAVAALEPDAVAVSLLFSFLNPKHEERLDEALADLDVPVSRSSHLLPVFREVERTSTTALNAYVAPRMTRYLGSLEQRLMDGGLSCPVEVMRSGGGTFTARVASREPVHTLLSGPAAGAWGAAAVGRLAGFADLVGCDMGGTSTDVALIEGGRPATTAEGEIDGLPFAVKTTDIHTIGSGGGSIAWRDEGGALRVGPRSSGAVPGPAAYGHGGEAPTVTDADVLLGRLPSQVRLGGQMPLRPDLAEEAVARLAGDLGLDTTGCAEGIVQVVEAQMVKALRVVSVERGHDPRGFTLVPFGGAGPLHQAALARELGCARVLVPPNPGVLSALGLLAAPTTVDTARSILVRLEDVDPGHLAGIWDELAGEARRTLHEQHVEVGRERRTADLRYHGQAFELEVDAGERPDPADLAAAFHAAHRERYGYDQQGEPVELVTLRVRAEGPAPELPLPPLTGGGSVEEAVLSEDHQVVIDGEWRTCRVVDRTWLAAGATLRGPLVLTGVDATCYVAPWQRGEIDEVGNLILWEAPHV